MSSLLWASPLPHMGRVPQPTPPPLPLPKDLHRCTTIPSSIAFGLPLLGLWMLATSARHACIGHAGHAPRPPPPLHPYASSTSSHQRHHHHPMPPSLPPYGVAKAPARGGTGFRVQNGFHLSPCSPPHHATLSPSSLPSTAPASTHPTAAATPDPPTWTGR